MGVQNESGTQMFIVRRGRLGVFIQSHSSDGSQDEKCVAELSVGDYFGEAALVLSHVKRSATVRALTVCELYSLSKENLDAVLVNHPDVRESMKSQAQFMRLKNDMSTECNRVSAFANG